MRRDIALTVGGCLLAVAAVIALFVYSVVRETPLTEAQLREYGAFVLPTPRELAPVQLLDHHGQPFDVGRLTGHWTLMFFGYTSCPDICPVTMAVLADAHRRLAEQSGQAHPFDVVMVTVDPDRDSVAALADYVPYFDPDFIGVTGDHGDIARLATSVNVAFGKMPGDTPENYLVDHSGNIVVINPRGHYHGFLKMPHKADAIAAVVHSLEMTW